MPAEKKREPDLVIFVVVLILLAIGLVMVFSASYLIAAEQLNDQYYFLRRQSFWVLIGLLGMFFFSKFDYKKLRRLAPFLVLISFFLLTMVYVPGVGVEVKEAQRWIGVAGFTIQPAEFTKLALIIFTAAYLSSQSVNLNRFWSSSFIPILITGLSFLFIVEQPDLGSALVLVLGVLLLIFIAGIPWRHLLILGGMALPAIIFFAAAEPYRLRRLTSFVDPWMDPLGAGYHVIQSLYALGPGGLFGVGLGRSRQKFYYLPEPHNDFIFSIIGEELGFIGALAVLLLFFILIWRGLKIALTVPDGFGSLLAAGITALIGLQVIINVGVVTGTLPVTGLNLPLISAGGSSLLFTLCGIGILLNISKHIKV